MKWYLPQVLPIIAADMRAAEPRTASRQPKKQHCAKAQLLSNAAYHHYCYCILIKKLQSVISNTQIAAAAILD